MTSFPEAPRAVPEPGASAPSRSRRLETVDEVTLVGLLLETAAGLRRFLAPNVEGLLGVGGQAFEVLIRLARSPGQRLRMSDLAAQTGLSPGGLTRSVDRLVEAGLAVRESCPNDRRGSFARLTELGAGRTAEALGRHREDVAALFDGLLSPEQVQRLAELVRVLRDRVHPDAGLVSPDEGPTPSGSPSPPVGRRAREALEMNRAGEGR